MQSLALHEDLPFLEPPHSHDVASISYLASIRTCMLDHLLAEVQEALWSLKESTSVVYASYSRLQDLVASRLDRLATLPNDPSAFNEGAFFTYQSQLSNERSYLLGECLPDWKHKLLHAKLDNYYDLKITHLGQAMTVKNWLDRLQFTVLYWSSETRQAQIPEFEETVSEHQSQSATPTSDKSYDSMGMTLGIDGGSKPVAAERTGGLLDLSKNKCDIGREIELAMGVRRAG